jgi:hypothetical protein
MARKIFQSEPIAITCRLIHNDDGIDIAGSALLEFKNGEAIMSFGFDRLYQNTYSVWGEKGLIRTDRAFALPPTYVPHIELVTNNGAQEHRETITVSATNQFALSFDFFCQAVAHKDQITIDGMYERILRQASALEAMRTSAREGKRVVL